MRVTIIRDDNVVIVDGEANAVDCSSLPANFHALQWDGARGEVEYNMVVCDHCNGRNKKPNEPISDLSPYQTYVDAWRVAKTVADEARAAEAAKAAATEGANAAGPQG